LLLELLLLVSEMPSRNMADMVTAFMPFHF
jgi:hypothetical protein